MKTNRHNRILRRLLISIALLSCVSACGWHLRGSLPLPSELRSAYVVNQEEQSAELSSLLAELLEANDVTVPETIDQAQLIITIVSQQNTRRIATLGTNARVSEYELNNEAVFGVTDARGQMLLPPTDIAVSRTYTYNENDVVGMAGEERLIQQEMLRELAQNILRRLRFLNLTDNAN